jgi:hypothetical protein
MILVDEEKKEKVKEAPDITALLRRSGTLEAFQMGTVWSSLLNRVARMKQD